MRLTDPDAMVKRLWFLRERLSSPLSSVPYEVSGSAWADSCAACGSRNRRRSDSGIERCARCGAAWWEVEGRVPKGSAKHRPRTNAMERAYFDLARCVAILSHVPEPERSLYEHFLDPREGGSRYAIDRARALGIIARPLPQSAFWDGIRTAREIVGLRLSIPDLLRSGRAA